MGNSSTITIYDNHSGNGSKSQISTRPSYFSIEELPSTLDEGFRFRPSHPRDEEEGGEEIDDNENDHDNDTVRHGNGKWKPGVKEWLVLICVSIVVMMDAFDATVIIPLVSVCKYLSFFLLVISFKFIVNLKLRNTLCVSVYPIPSTNLSRTSYGWPPDTSFLMPEARSSSPCSPRYSPLDHC